MNRSTNQGSQIRNPLFRNANRATPRVEFGKTPATRVYTGIAPAANGQWQNAQQLLRNGNTRQAQAIIDSQLQQNPSLSKLMSAVSTLEQGNAPASLLQTYRNRALELARAETRTNVTNPTPWIAIAKFSLEDQNNTAFRNAVSSLEQKFPNDKHTYYFQGIADLKDKNWKAAEQQFLKAREMGVPEESIAKWLKMAIDQQRWIWEYAWITLYVVLAWLTGLALLYVAGKFMSSRIVRILKTENLSQALRGHHLLRSAYRLLVQIASVYYYISLPLLVVVSIALPLTLGYALLNVPYLNLWLVALVFILSLGSIWTACSGIWTCFVGLNQQISGRKVTKAEQPELWALVKEVAKQVGTRPVDQIRLIGACTIAVSEQGTLLNRFRDKGTRVLYLGVGVLDGLSIDAFCCILAHEYGHFLNRDTAGGATAMRVDIAMQRFAQSITNRRQIRWWHIAFHFLRFYYRIFSRITFGASRLQEILADRVAVKAYGAASFEEGLRHVVRRSLEFDYWMNKGISKILQTQQPSLSFGPVNARPSLSALDQIEYMLVEIINRPTDESDTHPSSIDRFTYTKKMDQGKAAMKQGMVWQLFKSKSKIYDELSQGLAEILNDEAAYADALNKMDIAFLNSQSAVYARESEIYEERARLQLICGAYQQALDDYEIAIKCAPKKDSAYYGKAIVLKASEDYQQAAEALKAAMEQFPDSASFGTYFLLGECYQNIEEYAEAETAFTEAIKKEETAFCAWMARGRVLHQSGKYNEAVQDFSKALELFPESPDAFFDRAMAYIKLNQLDHARKDLEQSISKNASYADAHRELACLLLGEANDLNPDLAQQAVKYARIANASPIKQEESLSVLATTYTAVKDYPSASKAIKQLMPLLTGSIRSEWGEELSRIQALSDQGKPRGKLQKSL
ncbi:tetratricopeptide repeat protein [Gimesia sp.]|uniref:tetratricopeptide repeat protein n=1 Tax=Gimesia sp. TaxID=2024833 RepID=UPI003A949B89